MFKGLSLYLMIAAFAVGLGIGAAGGWKVGYNRAAEKGLAVAAAYKKDWQDAEADVAKLKGANERYETATLENIKAINAELQANMARQVTADRKNEALGRGMLDVAAQTAQNASVAREAIRNALDECAHAGMSTDTVRVLNSIRPPEPGAGLRADAVPAVKADH